jgi:NTE family protein
LVRYLLKGLGPLEDAAEIISYLSFDPGFCSILIDMGYEDGMAAKEEIIRILQS